MATREQTEKILQELLGLEQITDEKELNTLILQRMESLNKIDSATLAMKLGARIKELEDSEKGIQPPTGKVKIISSLMFILFSILPIWLIAKFNSNIIIKIILGAWAFLMIFAGFSSLIKIIGNRNIK